MSEYISNRKAYRFFQDEIRKLEKELHVRIHLQLNNGEEALGEGLHKVKNDNEMSITIGVPINFQPVFSENGFFDSISLSEFATITVLFYHECQHIRQQVSFLHQYDDRTLKFALDIYSVQDNEYYRRQEYGHSVSDIEAEKEGLRHAFSELSKRYGNTTAESLLKEYMTHRLAMLEYEPQYFGVDISGSIDDVLSRFEYRLQEELKDTSVHTYQTNVSKEVKMEQEKDTFYKHVIDNPENYRKFQVREIWNKWDFKKLMVSINAKVHGIKSDLSRNHILHDDAILEYCDKREKDYEQQLKDDEKYWKSLELEEELRFLPKKETTLETDKNLPHTRRDDGGMGL